VVGSTPSDVAEELALSPGEGVVLTAFQYRMMQRDIAAESSENRSVKKRPLRNDFRRIAVLAIAGLAEPNDDRAAETSGADAWAIAFSKTLANAKRSEQYALLEDAPESMGAHVKSRSRALLLVIDLYGFEPWDGERWVDKTRKSSLREAVAFLPPLREEDLDSVASEYRSVLRTLRRKAINWPRVLLLVGGGLGLGALTFGLAAPVIGAAVGSAVFGLSGAAATSAGLAALGGGSVAAGGLGMAGGTALLAGVGGAAGAGVAAAGGRWTGWTAGQVVADAIKLEVVTKLILLDAQGDDAKARKVVEGLHDRISMLSRQVLEMARTVDSLKRKLAEQKDVVARGEAAIAERDAEIARLKTELHNAKEQHQQVEFAKTALELVAGRIDDVL